MSSGRVAFASLFAALPTPFDARGRVDEAALAHLTDYLSERAFDGIAVLGEGAEDSVLAPEERKVVIDVVGRKTQGKRALLVGLSMPSTVEAVDLVRHATAVGAVGFLVGPPRVPGFGYRELYRHIEKIGRAHETCVYLVVRPDNATDFLSPEEIATLARHPRLSGVFLPGGSGEAFDRWKKRFKGREADIFAGCSLTFRSDAERGATAAICGLAILAAEAAMSLRDAVRKKDTKTAVALESRMQPAVSHLGPPTILDEVTGWKRLMARAVGRPLTATNMPPVVPFAQVKEALRLLGHPVQGNVRPPFEGLSKEQVEQLRAVLRASGLMS